MILTAENKNRVCIAVAEGSVCIGTDNGGTKRKAINAPSFTPVEARNIASLLCEAADLIDSRAEVKP